MEAFIFIYGLYDLDYPNEIKYIGKTNNVKRRLEDHLKDAKCGKFDLYKFRWINSVLKRGGDIGIKVIRKVKEKDWRKWEILYISKYKALGHELTNTTRGGEGFGSGKYNPFYGVKFIGKDNHFYGKHHSDETKEMIRKKKLGVKPTDEVREKLSKAQTGRKHPQEVKDKMSKAASGKNNHFYGKKHSKASRKKISKSNKKFMKKVGKYTLDGVKLKEFNSIIEAQKSVNTMSVAHCCRGEQKTAAGFVWKFI